MSHSDIAVSVRGLSKSYSLAHSAVQHTTAAEALVHRLKNPFHRPERETFWALRDVGFDIHRGDVVGIIGRNGAGKSTLLKVLSRITEPTSGRAVLNGRVGSLLEVGTGFHPELTGRENIYLNGAILGMTKREIARQFDAIVDFAGVEQFLDTPVKRYSSGMYVRLAFAVAAHLNPEILIVDEVLAVGDAEFQKKCLGKMKDVAQAGRTVLFVSHHMQAVTLLCNKGMFLSQGQVAYYGSVQNAITMYMETFKDNGINRDKNSIRKGSGEYRFKSVVPSKPLFECSEEKEVKYTIEKQRTGQLGKVYLSAHLLDGKGAVIAQFDSRLLGSWLTLDAAVEGSLTFKTPWLKPGTYTMDFGIVSGDIVDLFEHACSFEVSPILPYPAAVSSDAYSYGQVFGDFVWETSSTKLLEAEALHYKEACHTN